MSDIELFFSPGACSFVTMTALEEAGLDYRATMIDIRNGDQKTPEYLAINPKGKVPALRIDGRLMTENAAILHHLSKTCPTLLPSEGVERTKRLKIWSGARAHCIRPRGRSVCRADTRRAPPKE